VVSITASVGHESAAVPPAPPLAVVWLASSSPLQAPKVSAAAMGTAAKTRVAIAMRSLMCAIVAKKARA
jgi:hypothetical protein